MRNTPANHPGPPSRGRPPLRRLLPLLLGVLVLVLPATVALASIDAGVDNRSTRAEQADEGNGPSHCEEDDGPGHKDCKPENNPQPDDPPCDADHGHPGDNAKDCQEGPENPGSCEDGVDNDGDGLTDGDDPDCDDGTGGGPCEGAGGDADGDGVCGDGDNCPDTANADQADADGDGVGDACDTEGPSGDPSCSDGVDNDGDGLADGDDPDCGDGGGAQNLCTAAEEDPGLPLTEDTLGQTLWDGGLDALNPLTEDPERDGALSGPVGDAGTDTPLEPVTDEAACAVDLLIDSELGGDL